MPRSLDDFVEDTSPGAGHGRPSHRRETRTRCSSMYRAGQGSKSPITARPCLIVTEFRACICEVGILQDHHRIRNWHTVASIDKGRRRTQPPLQSPPIRNLVSCSTLKLLERKDCMRLRHQGSRRVSIRIASAVKPACADAVPWPPSPSLSAAVARHIACGSCSRAWARLALHILVLDNVLGLRAVATSKGVLTLSQDTVH